MFIPSYKKPSPGGGGVPSWSTGTDEEIVSALEAHYNNEINLTEYWAVGDERIVSLSAITDATVGENQPAQNVTLVILNVGGKELVTPINNHTTCAFIVGLKNSLSTTGHMFSSINTSGWPSSPRRTWCNNAFYNAIPSTIRGIFKQHYNYSAQTRTSTSATQTSDYFCLPSVKEITGTNGTTTSSEAAIGSPYTDVETNNTRLTYYETSTNTLKKLTDNAESYYSYWTSSKRYYTGSNVSRRNEMIYERNSAEAFGSMTVDNELGIAPQGAI